MSKDTEWDEGWRACREEYRPEYEANIAQLEATIELLKARLRVEGDKEDTK